MNHTATRALSLLVSLSALSTSVPAQEFLPVQSGVPWPTGGAYGGGSSFSRIEVGDFAGDQRKDVLMMRGSTAVWVPDAGIHQSFAPVRADVNDIDILPGSPDRFVLATSAGLFLESVKSDQSALQASTTLDAGAWLGARFVRVADVSGDGLPDIVGIASNGKTVLVKYQINGAFMPAPSFTLPYVVDAFELARWDAAPGEEIVAAAPEGLLVYSISGQLLALERDAEAGNHLAVLRDAGSTQDLIAWVTPAGSAQPTVQNLNVVGAWGTEPPVAMNGLDVVGLAAADFDADGLADLALSRNYTQEVELLHAFDSGPSRYNPIDVNFNISFVIGTSTPGGAHDADPLLTDIDNDGYVDVMLGGAVDENLWTVLGPLNEDLPSCCPPAPILQRLSIGSENWIDGWTGTDPVQDGVLTLDVIGIPAAALGLEAALWRQENGGMHVTPTPVSGAAPDVSAFMSGTADVAATVADVSGGIPVIDSIYFVAIRAYDGMGNYGPDMVVAFSTYIGTTDLCDSLEAEVDDPLPLPCPHIGEEVDDDDLNGGIGHAVILRARRINRLPAGTTPTNPGS